MLNREELKLDVGKKYVVKYYSLELVKENKNNRSLFCCLNFFNGRVQIYLSDVSKSYLPYFLKKTAV